MQPTSTDLDVQRSNGDVTMAYQSGQPGPSTLVDSRYSTSNFVQGTMINHYHGMQHGI